MRTIKFRGLRTDGKGWVYGNLINIYDPTKKEDVIIECYIHECTRISNFIEIIPKTVGQFTGLTDKNGVDIYEGDIVKWLFQSGDFAPSFEESVVKYQEYADGWIGFEVFNKAEVVGNIHQK